MQKYVISISRQFGSLGRPIAKKLAELLEIEYYDRDIVEKASKVHNIPLKEASNLEESAKYLFMSFRSAAEPRRRRMPCLRRRAR